jgi:hypothetical protein
MYFSSLTRVKHSPLKPKKMKKQLTHQILIFAAGLALSSCCGMRMATCPDGRPISFPKSESCAAKIYRDDIKDFEANLKATVNVVDKVTVGVQDLSIKRESQALSDKLDQESSRLVQTLKASYLGLIRDPCSNSERHFKLVESVNAYNYKLQEIKKQLDSKTQEAELGKTVNDFLYQRGKEEGRAVGQMIRMLDNYFNSNQKYPESLDNIDAKDQIQFLNPGRLEYNRIKENEYTLRFAGEDYIINTADDKLYRGVDGKTN